ncbi:MAG TPA: phosphodiester glycosidase family protein [Solirubrobacteraceae bacterium]|nr:phosphodiester glycosidase family protein [Solirubrobacteraceae bacterium]
MIDANPSPGHAARSGGAGPPLPAIVGEQAIGPGTTLMRVREPPRGDATEAFVIRVNLTDPHVRASLLYPGRIAAVQPLSTMARGAGAFAAVNGDFFNIGHSGAPVGPVVSGGQLLKGPERGRELVAGVGIDGIGQIGDVWLQGQVTLPGGATRVLSVLNDAAVGPQPMLGPNGIALFTDQWGAYPLSGYILLGAGSGGRTLARLHNGQSVTVAYREGTNAVVPFRFAVGGKYLLLDDGRVPPGIPGGPGRPRIADHGHELFLSVTAGQQPGVPGLSLAQEAGFLRSLGVASAVALDDGGSSTMVARLRPHGPLELINEPSDGPEREVANGVGVFDAGRGP